MFFAHQPIPPEVEWLTPLKTETEREWLRQSVLGDSDLDGHKHVRAVDFPPVDEVGKYGARDAGQSHIQKGAFDHGVAQ